MTLLGDDIVVWGAEDVPAQLKSQLKNLKKIQCVAFVPYSFIGQWVDDIEEKFIDHRDTAKTLYMDEGIVRVGYLKRRVAQRRK